MKIRYFAGAAEAAGRDADTRDAVGLTVAELINLLSADNDRLGKVLAASSLLADGVRVASPDADLSDVTQLDVLPPFAGG